MGETPLTSCFNQEISKLWSSFGLLILVGEIRKMVWYNLAPLLAWVNLCMSSQTLLLENPESDLGNIQKTLISGNHVNRKLMNHTLDGIVHFVGLRIDA